ETGEERGLGGAETVAGDDQARELRFAQPSPYARQHFLQGCPKAIVHLALARPFRRQERRVSQDVFRRIGLRAAKRHDSRPGVRNCSECLGIEAKFSDLFALGAEPDKTAVALGRKSILDGYLGVAAVFEPEVGEPRKFAQGRGFVPWPLRPKGRLPFRM